MKNILLITVILITPMIFQCCRPTNKVEEMGDTTTAADHTVVNGSDKPDSTAIESGIQAAMFIEQAALGGLLEIELGKLAREKAGNSKVKKFGKLMEQEHSRINDSLKVLSSAKGLKLPVSLPEKDLEQIHKMEKMKNEQFDSRYLKVTIEDHEKYMVLLRGAEHSPDVAIGNFCRRFLPVLESHRQKAMKIREDLKKEAENSLLRVVP